MLLKQVSKQCGPNADTTAYFLAILVTDKHKQLLFTTVKAGMKFQYITFFRNTAMKKLFWIGLTLILNHAGFSGIPNFCGHRNISMT